MEHIPCALKYALEFKSFGVANHTEHSYFGKCEYDETDWQLEKNEYSQKNDNKEFTTAPAPTMQELHWILYACDHAVSYGGGDLPDDLVRLTLYGSINLDVKIRRGDRTDTDLIAECVLKLLKDEVIDGDFINEVLIRNYKNQNALDKLHSIEHALETMEDIVESLKRLIFTAKTNLDELLKENPDA